MIVCIRTISVPRAWRGRYLAWIEGGQATRELHGILGELVVRNSDDILESRGDIEYVVITLWPSHEPTSALGTKSQRSVERRRCDRSAWYSGPAWPAGSMWTVAPTSLGTPWVS